jgi:hypothetical protein
MPAFIKIEFGFCGFPGGIPGFTFEFTQARSRSGLTFLYVEIPAIAVLGDIVVPISGKPPEPGIPIKRVAPGGIGKEGKEAFGSQIVDPGMGCAGSCNHILSR